MKCHFGHSNLPIVNIPSFFTRSLLFLLALRSLFELGTDKLSCAYTYVERNFTFDQSGERGSFESPEFSTGKHPEEIIAIYRFVAKPGDKVMIDFDKFQLYDVFPDCINDYIDVYIDFENDNYYNSPSPNQLLNRYCGDLSPGTLVSVQNVVLIAFFAHDPFARMGFNGSYHFLKGSAYYQSLLEARGCSYLYMMEGRNHSRISGRLHSKRIVASEQDLLVGIFKSYSYPGVYVANKRCLHYFRSSPGYRIRVDIHDLAVYQGRDHCPYDYVNVYDGSDDTSPLIKRLCGQWSNVTFYSKGSSMTIEFVSHTFEYAYNSSIRAESTIRRGFIGSYTASLNFVDIGFISGSLIPGTHCDQQFTGRQEHGFFYSPAGWNMHHSDNDPSDQCTYTLIGQDDAYAVDKIQIRLINITGCSPAQSDTNRPMPTAGYSKSDDSSLDKETSRRNGDWETQVLNVCDVATSAASSGMFIAPYSALKISAKSGQHFVAEYWFIPNYHEQCEKQIHLDSNTLFVHIHSDSIKAPISSDNKYLAGLTCSFNFTIDDSVCVIFHMRHFNLISTLNCTEDWLELSTMDDVGNVTKDLLCQSNINKPFHPFSVHHLRYATVVLNTDQSSSSVASDGFHLDYVAFGKAGNHQAGFEECETGDLTIRGDSYYYRNYLLLRKHSRHPVSKTVELEPGIVRLVSLNPEMFNSMRIHCSLRPSRPSAALSVGSMKQEVDLCQAFVKKTGSDVIVSLDDNLRIYWLSTPLTDILSREEENTDRIMAHIRWTRHVRNSDSLAHQCPQYQCPLSGACIHTSLVCNGIADCPDSEDEEHCSPRTSDQRWASSNNATSPELDRGAVSIMAVALPIVLLLLLVTLTSAFIIFKRPEFLFQFNRKRPFLRTVQSQQQFRKTGARIEKSGGNRGEKRLEDDNGRRYFMSLSSLDNNSKLDSTDNEDLRTIVGSEAHAEVSQVKHSGQIHPNQPSLAPNENTECSTQNDDHSCEFVVSTV